jgi:hypothetical protein
MLLGTVQSTAIFRPESHEKISKPGDNKIIIIIKQGKKERGAQG